MHAMVGRLPSTQRLKVKVVGCRARFEAASADGVDLSVRVHTIKVGSEASALSGQHCPMTPKKTSHFCVMSDSDYKPDQNELLEENLLKWCGSYAKHRVKPHCFDDTCLYCINVRAFSRNANRSPSVLIREPSIR
jgi:hypothetical protein